MLALLFASHRCGDGESNTRTSTTAEAPGSTGDDDDTTTGDGPAGTTAADPAGSEDGPEDPDTSGGDEPMPDLPPAPPPDPPMPVEPCINGACFSQLSFSSVCSATEVTEDFSSGNYNVHQYPLRVAAGVPAEITLSPTAGMAAPLIVIHDEAGATIYDGELGLVDDAYDVQSIATGQDGQPAAVSLVAQQGQRLMVSVSAWEVLEGDFVTPMPTDVEYALEVTTICEPPGITPPPNFDETDIVDGYYLLPYADPEGLYTRREDGCSRGNQLLIDVLYTAALRWSEVRPELAPFEMWDLNEGPCSTVDHSTHDDGTHADLHIDCGTEVDCANWIPAFDLARIFIHTGEVCGIIFNDEPIQDIVNPYFESHHDFDPWHGTFMRSVGSHVIHFHVRVKRPDGTCFPA